MGYFHPGAKASEHITPRLYRAVLHAAAHLCRKYGIPPEHVKYHREVKATACPGEWFPLGKLREELDKILSNK